MADRRRILLADFHVSEPQPAARCAWSQSSVHTHPDLDVDSEGRTVRFGGPPSGWRRARATPGLEGVYGQWYWELTFSFSGSATFADFAAGMCDFEMAPTGRPGRSAASVGVERSGEVRCQNQIVGALGELTTFDVLCFWLDNDAAELRVRRNAGPWVTLRAADWPWLGSLLRNGAHPAVSLFRSNGLQPEISATINAGQAPFLHPVPDGANDGAWRDAPAAQVTLRAGSESFYAGDAHYAALVARDPDVIIERAAGCWPWGSKSSARWGQLVLVNPDGGLDHWLDYDWRDARVDLRRGAVGDDVADFSVWSTAVVDAISVEADRLVVTLLDPLAALDVALQQHLFSDTTQTLQARGQPIPIVLGRPLYCTPVRTGEVAGLPQYAVHDQAGNNGAALELQRVDAVWDRGSRFAGPDDPYVPSTTITAGNGGNLDSWVGTPPRPVGWPQGTEYTPADGFSEVAVSPPRMNCRSSGQLVAWLQHAATVPTGRHVLSFEVYSVSIPGTLYAAVGPTLVPIAITAPGTVQVVLDVLEAGHRFTLGLGPFRGMPGSVLAAHIHGLRLSSQQLVDWTYLTAPGVPAGFELSNVPDGPVVCNPVGSATGKGVVKDSLADTVRAVLARTSGAPAYSDEDLTRLVGGTRRVADYITQPATVLGTLGKLLDGCCGWVAAGRDGRLRFGQLRAPERSREANPRLELSRRNVVAVRVEDDLAKGLSLRLAGRRNHTPHRDADLISTASEAWRSELQAEWGAVVEAASRAQVPAVAAAYVAARDAPAVETLLQEPGELQAEANRVATLFRQRRRFYHVTSFDESGAGGAELGEVVRLTWPRFGLEGGRPLMVVRVRSGFFSNQVELTLWG